MRRSNANATRSPLRSVLLLGLLAISALAVALAGHAGPTHAEGNAPQLLLPWEDGQEWRTGISGFHTVRDALDFFPPDTALGLDVRCEGDPNWVDDQSSRWVLASASGTVTYASDPMIIIDHGNGWSTGYYHMTALAVSLGDEVQAGQPIAHPSTHGACATGPHVHFWAEGPGGQTTRNVELSGRPAPGIDINEVISETGNFRADAPPSPTPTVTPTDTPNATETPAATTTPPASATAVPTPSPSPTPSPPTPSPTASPVPTPRPSAKSIAGDVDCSGTIDALDAVATLRHAGHVALTADCVSSSGDVNCDGLVNGADALAILRHLANLAPTPAPCPSTGL